MSGRRSGPGNRVDSVDQDHPPFVIPLSIHSQPPERKQSLKFEGLVGQKYVSVRMV